MLIFSLITVLKWTLAIEVSDEVINKLFELSESENIVNIDLENQALLDINEKLICNFEIEPFRKKCFRRA